LVDNYESPHEAHAIGGNSDAIQMYYDGVYLHLPIDLMMITILTESPESFMKLLERVGHMYILYENFAGVVSSLPKRCRRDFISYCPNKCKPIYIRSVTSPLYLTSLLL